MRFPAHLICIAACFSLGACGPRFGRVDPREGDMPAELSLPSTDAIVAGFEPVRVRIHPLSRFEGVGENRRAVVDVEVLDAFGQGVKWPGLLRVESSADGTFEGATARWMDLTDPEANARAFDGISRCYPVRVPAPGTAPLTVRVRWVQATAGGRAVGLEASGTIAAGK